MASASAVLFTEQELRSLLEREEGQFLEFKSLWDLSKGSNHVLDRRQARDFVAECVAAFANADGGTLVLGVEDDGTPSGHGYPAETVADLLAARPEGFANADYQNLNGVDRDQAYREIQEMVAVGAVMPAEMPGRGAVYCVAPDLQETRAFLQARLPRLREFLARRPFLQNADYRHLFGVTRIQAVRELGRLVLQGCLLREGRGRGARYGSGPGLGTKSGK